jgi:hypothetical protein
VVDVFGQDLPYNIDVFIDSRTGENLAPRFIGLNCSGVPLGPYRYRLVRSDLRGEAGWLTGQIDVGEKEVLRVLLGDEIKAYIGGRPAAVSLKTPTDFSIVGTIKPPPERIGSLWVRLKGVYQNYQVDLTVDANGVFQVGEPLQGLFVLLVVDHGAIVGVQPIIFKQGSTSAHFTVELKDIGANAIIVDRSSERR